MSSQPEPTRQFLNSPMFQDIHRRIETGASLLKKIKAALPGPMAAHCLHCVAREDGSLVVYADSQAFASQLRFHVPSILARLNAGGETAVKRIAVRNFSLAAQQAPQAKPMAPMKKPSARAIAAIKDSARAAGIGDELAAALARLGATMERYAETEQTP